MARKRSRRDNSGWPTRPLPLSSLGHTVGPRSRLFRALGPPPLLSPVRSPLIRTVLENSSTTYQPSPRRGIRASPVLRSRATGRSSQRSVRSPFLTATAVTPELTERAIICAKRGIRREVLFARRKTGQGSKSPRRKPSRVRC